MNPDHIIMPKLTQTLTFCLHMIRVRFNVHQWPESKLLFTCIGQYELYSSLMFQSNATINFWRFCNFDLTNRDWQTLYDDGYKVYCYKCVSVSIWHCYNSVAWLEGEGVEYLVETRFPGYYFLTDEPTARTHTQLLHDLGCRRNVRKPALHKFLTFCTLSWKNRNIRK